MCFFTWLNSVFTAINIELSPVLVFIRIFLLISICRENVQKLFEYWCEISPTAIGEKVSGVIVESFPERFKDPEIISKIPEFAYPCQFLK